MGNCHCSCHFYIAIARLKSAFSCGQWWSVHKDVITWNYFKEISNHVDDRLKTILWLVFSAAVKDEVTAIADIDGNPFACASSFIMELNWNSFPLPCMFINTILSPRTIRRRMLWWWSYAKACNRSIHLVKLSWKILVSVTIDWLTICMLHNYISDEV